MLNFIFQSINYITFINIHINTAISQINFFEKSNLQMKKLIFDGVSKKKKEKEVQM
jgi:hypothetical protein